MFVHLFLLVGFEADLGKKLFWIQAYLLSHHLSQKNPQFLVIFFFVVPLLRFFLSLLLLLLAH